MFSSAAAVAVARVFSLVCAAVQLPLMTRMLEPAEFGVVSVAIAAATYFSLVSAEPTVLGFQRFPGSRDTNGNYWFASRRIAVCSALAALGVILVGAVLHNVMLSIAIVAWGTGIAVNRLVSTAWLMWGEPWRYAANLVIATGVRTLALVLPIAWGADASLAVSLAGVATALAALTIAPSRRGGQPDTLRPWTWRLSLNLGLASLAFTLLMNAPLVMAPLLIGPDDVGRYAATSQVVMYSSAAILGLLLTVLYPDLRRRWDDGAHDDVRLRIRGLAESFLLVACGAILALSAGDSWGPRLIVGDLGQTEAVAAITLSSALGSIGMLASWERQFELRVSQVNARAWIAALCGVAATLIAAMSLGVAGVVIGYSVGYLIYFLVQASGSQVSASLRIGSSVLLLVACVHATTPNILTAGWLSAIILVATISLIGMLIWRVRVWKRMEGGGI